MIYNGTAGNDRLIGTSEGDIFRGLRGNDYFDGRGGADTYYFNQGDGQDVIEDSSNDVSIDKLIFSGTGLTSTNAIVTGINGTSDLKLSFRGSSDTVILKDQIWNDLTASYGLEQITFSNGVTWTKAQLWASYLATGSSTSDQLWGTSGNDIFRGGLGSDYLRGSGGADTYLFQAGDGQDVIEDNRNDVSIDKLIFSGTGLTSTNAIVTGINGTSDLKISFRGSSDTVILKDQIWNDLPASYGLERITFSNGVTWTKAQLWASYLATGSSTSDQLWGTSGNDIFRGGLGSDYLRGSGGADTYLFQAGDGQDVIEDNRNDVSIDKLIFSGGNLTSTNVIVTGINGTSDLKISFRGSSDTVILKDQIWNDLPASYGLERITFSNGVTWTKAQLWASYLATGSSTSDQLWGTSGNDIFRGGLGSDYLRGSGGADTYLFQAGDGQDVIEDNRNDASIDQLIFSGTGLTSTNAIVTGINGTSDLKISFRGSSDTVILKDQIWNDLPASYGLERITFSNGVTWTKGQLWSSYLNTGASTSDQLFGTSGNDVMRGGQGTDYLQGFGGADTYLFQAGDGQDIIEDNRNDAATDRLVLSGSGLTSTNVRATRVQGSTDVQLSFGGTSDTILLKYQTWGGNYGLENIQFSNGVTWNRAQLASALR